MFEKLYHRAPFQTAGDDDWLFGVFTVVVVQSKQMADGGFG